MSPLRSFARARGGGTAVEFALVVIPMLLTLAGVVEFGRYFWISLSLQRTATRAARCMGLLQSDCASSGAYSASATTSFIQTQALAYGTLLNSGAVTLNNAASCAGVSGFSTVQISYSFSPVFPMLAPSLAKASIVTAKACFPNQS